MLIALIVSQVLVWVLLAALVVAGLALARQVGVLHERVAPMGALTPRQGPAVSEIAPLMQLPSVNGGAVTIGGPAMRPRLVMFVGPSCPICKKMIPLARRVAQSDGLDLILATDAPAHEVAEMVAREGLADLPFVNSEELGMAYGVDKLPHAALISEGGTILARGLVNSREHLESLVVARELGVGSVQDFLRGHASHDAA
jgi:methylamine dehydrogenase accessory protein MauD